MTTFGWKRKAGEKVDKHSFPKSVFNSEEDADDLVNSSMDWIKSLKRKRSSSGESSLFQIEEFKNRGIQLAETGMYPEAVKQWDRALQLSPSDAKILEMKAQALLQMNCASRALHAARRAVMCDPLWWVAYQTLGRTQLSLGDIHMAVLSFSKALHINPEVRELWVDDLGWAVELLNKQKLLESESKQKEVIEND